MSYKKLILLLMGCMAIIILCLFGISYAYYSLSNASTEFNTKTLDDNIDVIYQQSQYINTNVGIPIADNDAALMADSSKFSALAGPSLTGYQVAIQIDLVDIVLSDELKISDFKIQLLENGNVVATKTGQDIGNNTSITLKDMTSITVGTTYNYELRVWLRDTGVSQNTLMNKSLNGRVEVSSAVRK